MVIPALRDASEDRALRGAPLTVYVWLLHHLELHGHRSAKTHALARALGLRRQTIGEALTVLVRRGYLEEGVRDGKLRTFRLLSARRDPDGPLTVPRRSA